LKQKAIVLSPKDNVATALVDLKAEDTLELEVGGETQAVKLTADVPFSHKFIMSLATPETWRARARQA